MKKFLSGVVVGIIIGIASLTLIVPLTKRGEIEGIYFAHPPQLNTSIDFRNNGTMLMVSSDIGEWFQWKVENGKIYAQATSEKYKGKEIVFDIKEQDLFLGNIRFRKTK